MSKLATNKFKWTVSSTGRETTRFGIVMIKSSVFCQSPFKIKFFATNISLCSLAWLSSSKLFEKVCSQCWQSICFGWDLLVWFSNSSSERKVSLHFLQKPFIPSRSSSSSSLSSSSHHVGRAGKSWKMSARGNLLNQKCPQLCVIFDKNGCNNFSLAWRWELSLLGISVLESRFSPHCHLT